jgi:hypothetical protein
MYTINLPVDYHQQDKGALDRKFYCGPACAQMVLNQIGSGLSLQDPLYADCNSHSRLDCNVNWATAPDGLRWTMNARKPRSFVKRFKLIAKTDKNKISRTIAWTIHNDQVAPIALIRGYEHWVVVRGFDSDVPPSGARDSSYSIKAFWINDPSPPGSERIPAHPSSPHSQGDLCGSGLQNYGEPNTHINYVDWLALLRNGVPEGYWVGKFIAICDPGPDDEGDNKDKDKLRGKKKIDGQKLGGKTMKASSSNGGDNDDKDKLPGKKKIDERKLGAKTMKASSSNEGDNDDKNKLPGKKKIDEGKLGGKTMKASSSPQKVIAENKAKQAAMSALQYYGWKDQPFLKGMLKNVQPGNPTLVRRLDKKNQYYYIVPLVAKKKNIYSLVNIDGIDAKYRQASFAKDVQHPIVFKILSAKKIVGLVKIRLKLNKVKKVVVSPYLVWKPCIQSFSPNSPFYLVTIDNHSFYVRLDGQIFSELTQGPPGA